jgi:gluconokinase
MVVVLMGVAGCGKTTVGRELAGLLGWHFCDADNHHPSENREKMRRGLPLTEADRQPWLEALAALIAQWRDDGEEAVLACSALTARSREQLRAGDPELVFVHLRGPEALLRRRLAERAGHFFAPELLPSQLATLEPPTNALEVSIEPSPSEIAREIRHRLGSRVCAQKP